MKILFNPFRIVLILIAVSILLYSCEKDDTEDDLTNKEIFITDFIADISSDNMESYVQWLQNMGTRYALNDNIREIAVEIQQKFILFGYTDAELDSFYLLGYNSWQYNVIATLNGSVNPDSICILGAHYDSYSDDPTISAPGADDNASGVSAVLEIARVMKKNNYIPNTTIKFIAFAAEEIGLKGSNDYAKKASLNGEKIKMMLNEDMIAYEPSKNKSDWVVSIIDYDNSHDLRIKTEDIAATYTELSTVNDNEYYDSSDSYSFYEWGYEALFFISYSEYQYYHTEKDIIDYCNLEYCREVAKLSCAIVLTYN